MRKSMWCGLLCLLLLTGCKTFEEMWADADNAKCQSYGSRPGEPAYVQCRAQLDAARSISTSQDIAGMNAANAARSYRPPVPVCINSSIGPIC
jgi:hypothetical protein